MKYGATQTIKNYRRAQSSDGEVVQKCQREFEDNLQALQKELDEEYQAWRAYTALDSGQYTEKEISEANEQERYLYQYDIIGPKLDTAASSIVSEMPDIDWSPAFGNNTAGCLALRRTWIRDKEIGNFEYAMSNVIRDGMVHCGWLEQTEGFVHDPAGHARWERILPGFGIPDAYWISDDDGDMEVFYKIAYFLPEQMAEKWESKHDDIMRAVDEIKRSGRQAPPSNAAYLRILHTGQIGDAYRVIARHWIENIRTIRLMGYRKDTSIVVPFPVTEDTALINAFGEANGVDWETVRPTPYTDKIHNRTIICPDLSMNLVLADGKSPIQTKRLPFHHFTILRYNGRNKGLCRSILDVQRTMNKREGMVNESVDKANGGAELWNDHLFTDPVAKQRWVKKKNKPGFADFADLDAVQKTHIKVGPAEYSAPLVNQIDRMWTTVLPLVSRVSDSMSAIAEPNESGILFDKKYQVNKLANFILNVQFRAMLQNIGEGYMYQFPITYGKIPRTISDSSGKSIILNERSTKRGPGGELIEVITNPVEYMPRNNVIVHENVNSSTFQLRSRMLYSELMGKVPQDSIWYPLVVSKFMSSLDTTGQDKAMIEMANTLALSKSQMQIISEMTKLHADMKVNALTSAQADQQLQQLMMQYQGAQQMSAPAAMQMPVDEMTIMPEQGAAMPAEASESNYAQESMVI
jgi:hypothetical protein